MFDNTYPVHPSKKLQNNDKKFQKKTVDKFDVMWYNPLAIKQATHTDCTAH